MYIGARALTAKVKGPRFNPRWLPVFHGFLKNILKPFLTHKLPCVFMVHGICTLSEVITLHLRETQSGFFLRWSDLNTAFLL